MASKKEKPKKLTREDIETMPHSELASVKTKRRLLASLPSAADEQAESDQGAEDDETLSPRERISRGIAKDEKEAGNADR